jgi:hypothetical protein
MTDMNKYEYDTDNDTYMFGGNDFVLMNQINEDGKTEIVGGGYKVNSFFLQGGESPLITFNQKNQEGGKVSSSFENLAVPAGLFYVNQPIPKHFSTNKEYYKDHDTISDDMIDKLFGLIEANKKQKRKTRKNIYKINNRKSKKQLH